MNISEGSAEVEFVPPIDLSPRISEIFEAAYNIGCKLAAHGDREGAIAAFIEAINLDDSALDWCEPGDKTLKPVIARKDRIFQETSLIPVTCETSAPYTFVGRVRALNYALRFDAALEFLETCTDTSPQAEAFCRVMRERVVANKLWFEKQGYVAKHDPATFESPPPAGMWSIKADKKKNLLLEGFMFFSATAFIFLNDRIVKAANASEKVHPEAHIPWRLSHKLAQSVISSFPSSIRLSVGTEAGGLLLKSGAPFVKFRNRAGGTDLCALLDTSHIITKKGGLITRLSTAEKWQRDVLRGYSEMASYFKQTFEYELFVVYGTLLGIIRSGEFIDGDDDVDIAYFSDKKNVFDAKEEACDIARQMVRDGWNVRLTLQRRPFKLLSNGLWFGVMVSWQEDGRIWMLQTTSFVGEPDILLPLKSMPFKGVEIKIPNKSEEFLEHVYGATWQTPDPGYRSPIKPLEIRQHLGKLYLTKEECEEIRQAGVLHWTDVPTNPRGLLTQEPAPDLKDLPAL